MAERITSVLKAAATKQLGALAIFKGMIEKSDTSSDALITFYLNEASRAFERSCRRTFGRETVIDQFTLDPDAEVPQVIELKTSHYPVTAVYAVGDYSQTSGFQTLLATGIDNVQTTLPCVAALIGYQYKAGLFPFNIIVDVDGNVEVMTVNSLSSGTTYNVTRGVAGVTLAHSSGAKVAIAVDPLLYRLDAERGMITKRSQYGVLQPWNTALPLVIYQGGYLLPNDSGANLPTDIEGAVYKAMRYLWQTRGRDPSIRSTSEPGIGQITYWMGEQPDVQCVVEDYREARL